MCDWVNIREYLIFWPILKTRFVKENIFFNEILSFSLKNKREENFKCIIENQVK